MRGANWLGLMALAGDLGALGRAPAALGETDDPSMPELLLAAFARAADDFLRAGGPRRLHGTRREVLRGRVRGRPLLPALLREVSRGRADRVPCEFASHHLDNAPNRVLLAAVRRLRAESRHTALDRLEAALPDTLPGRDDMRRCGRLPGHFAHYADLLGLAALVLGRLGLADRPGRRPAVSLSVSLPEVFERAFQRSARRMDAEARAHPEWPVRVGEDGGGVMVPDVYVPAREGHAALVVDLKWKLSLERGELNHPDLYQLIAYAHAAQAQQPGAGVVAALVYPSADEGEPLEVRVGEASPLRLYLAPWRVTGDCGAHFAALWGRLRSCRSG